MNLKMKAKEKEKAKANNATEEFLEHRRKKTWIDLKTGHKCFMLYPRSLFITWGNRDPWAWNCFKETGDENIEVVKLREVCWLDVRGKFKISELSPGVSYEVVYVAKLTDSASGWELPVSLKLSVPAAAAAAADADGIVVLHRRQVSLLEKPRGEWFELNLGNFSTNIIDDVGSETAHVCFDLFEHGGHWKSGLILQGAILRPKM